MSRKVIGFHYTVKTEQGELIDTSDGKTPLLFLEGSGQIIPGLEKELATMSVGDKKDVKVDSDNAYGPINEELKYLVKKDQFPDGSDVKVGDQFQLENDPAAPIFTVTLIENDDVFIDGNHPLAGINLEFNVEITEKRDATEEELAHGHAHGAGGHQHEFVINHYQQELNLYRGHLLIIWPHLNLKNQNDERLIKPH